MQIITVIPIKRGIGKDTLSYFTQKEVLPGTIATIPVRKKNAYGLIIESKNAENLKSEIKSLPYSIKKIGNIKSKSIISPEFVEAAKKIADWNAGSVGAVLHTLVPKAIIESNLDLSFSKENKDKESFYETLLIQGEDSERYSTYKGLIREEFAKGRSVFFCLPTIEDLLNAKGVLEKGIEKYTYAIHSNLKSKEIINLWKKIKEAEHPVLIISTGSFLSLPKDRLGTIIIDKESSRAYKIQTRPYIDIRQAAQFIAKENKIKLIMGDVLLRVETLWEEKQGKYAELSPLKFRALSNVSSELISMRHPQDMKKKEWSILSDKLIEVLKRSKENNEHTFLFCGRKGLYPITVCSDCGTVVVCRNCNAPVVLYGKPANAKGAGKGNLFVCHHCGERRDADELCIHCKGWRLNPMGIGTENVVLKVKELFPTSKVIIMDKDHLKNHKEAVKARDEFYNTPGGILIGTEMALNYLNQKVENSAVVSIDAYFGIPDYQINEKVFHILLTLRGETQKNFIIQTRQEENSNGYKIFDYALRGNLIDFYRDEIEDRKIMNFPPFRTFIKITLEGEKSEVKNDMQEIKKFLEPYTLLTFDGWNPMRGGKFSTHGLISLQKDKWIDYELLEKLRALPQSASIKVDPLTLL